MARHDAMQLRGLKFMLDLISRSSGLNCVEVQRGALHRGSKREMLQS